MATEKPGREVTAGPEPIEGHPTPGTHIWGWMTVQELDWLHASAKRMGSIVEIGSLRGRSAFALATACAGPVYCIDPFDDFYGKCQPAFMENVGYLENVHPIKGWSPAAASEVPGQVDMVFIDGAHDYDSVIADIEAWLPKTRTLICGHDYDNGGYPDVRTAVHDRFDDAQVTVPAGMIWAVEIS